ncbi:MAG TPA: XrtB/PEP-CTERM-associated polysaccharide biosynthesis outer membrane protein EpsL [Pelomicrobium sp.]|nr:XrtB/PEP-CTERM-associated polysaccharide biosynthesis outer membrane protein EpsL [Pelomicrobium sp.]
MSLVAGIALAVAMTSAEAKHGDVFSPYAFAGYTYDDNLLRLPDGVSAPAGDGTPRRGDQVLHYGAGLILDKPISRQRFYANLAYRQDEYNHFSQLDLGAPAVDAYWAWQVGNLWSGTLGYERTRALSSFDDLLVPQKNIRTQQRYYFRPRYELAASLRVKGALEYHELDNDRFVDANREDTAYELGIERVAAELGTLGLFVRHVDGDYPERAAAPLLSGTGFEQTDFDLRFDWRITGASRLVGRAGYTDRDAPGESFGGITGRMLWDWVPTGKTTVAVVVRREFEYPEDRLGNGALVQAVSVEPKWNATAKISFGAFAEYRERDRALSPIDERYRLLGLSATYAPNDNLQLSLSYLRDRRRTDLPVLDYDANVLSGSAQISF